MIYVTVGTTQFEELVLTIDNLALKIKDEIIIQIGNGKYIPKRCKYFRFTKDNSKYYKKADLIIAHGGAGTTFEVLNLHKKLISVDNPKVPNSHQWDLIKKLSQQKYLIWCKDMIRINEYIMKCEHHKFKKYENQKCIIDKKIIEFLK